MSDQKERHITDVFQDFEIAYEHEGPTLKPGPRLPKEALSYLRAYVERTSGRKNICRNGRFSPSLYTPPLNDKSGKRALSQRLRRKFLHFRVPDVATIGMTKHCQCRCNHCSANHHMNVNEPDLNREMMISAIRESVDLGVCNVIMVGGEPLLRNDLDELIASVDKALAIVTLFTNGELLSKRRAQRLKQAGLFGLFVSLDSCNPEEHDTLRKRPGLFSKALKGIANAQSAGLSIAISTYITSEKYHEGHLDSMMDLARSLEVDEVTVFDAIPTGRMASGCHSHIYESDRKAIVEKISHFRRDQTFPALSAQSSLTSSYGNAFCFAGNTQFYLSCTGQFCPCDFTPLTIGRYPERSIKALWQALITSTPYQPLSKRCRMQDEGFRRTFIDTIPADALLPYPISA